MKVSSEYFLGCIVYRGCELLMRRVVFKSSFIWGAIKLALHMEQPMSLRLNQKIRLKVKINLESSTLIFQKF
jgi:hypothetical protein